MNWEQLYRREWPGLVARLIRVTGDWALAEDCVQESFARAWTAWGTGPRPDKPAAWLYTVARNLALDRWRRSKVEEAKLRLLESGPETPAEDSRLALIFTCCHPSLPLEGQVALTLRVVAGLPTSAVARAFLVSDETMTRRLTRARAKIEQAGVPLVVPDQPFRPERLAGVLGVLYLLFNQGNDAAANEPARAVLADEALELARLVAELLPSEPEASGALALLLLTRAGRPARFGTGGEPITLDKQDRTLWDQGLRAQGLAELDRALSLGSPGPYALQAAIAGCHTRAERADQTDFSQIAGLYQRLESLTPTPVVRLNRAVAVGLAQGPGAALALLEELTNEPALARYPWFPAACADALGRLNRWEEAAAAWQRAADLAAGPTEKAFFEDRSRDAQSRFSLPASAM